MPSKYRVKIKVLDKEIDISGTKEEVLETFDKNLPFLVQKFSEAFEISEVPIEKEAIEQVVEAERGVFPQISGTTSCQDAIIKLLSTEWGKKPRPISEIQAALQSNALFYPITTLSGILVRLVRQGKLRRWKTAAGYVYVGK